MSGCVFSAQVTRGAQKGPAYSPDPINRARKKYLLVTKYII